MRRNMAPRDREESSRPSNRRQRPRNSESAKRRDQRKKKSHHRRPATASDDTREDAGSHSLSSNALAALNKQHAKQKKHGGDRDRRKPSYRIVEADADKDQPRTRKPPKRKKKRVVSGAIMEEGRARGHGRNWSDDSYEKEEYYVNKKKKSWSKKKKLGAY